MENCDARRGDTHITEPAQRYVYPLFFFFSCCRKYRRYHLTTPSNTTRFRTGIKQFEKWNIVALAVGIHVTTVRVIRC